MFDKFTRRQTFGLAAGAVAISALPDFARAKETYPVNNLGMALLPLKIINNSGNTQPIYIWLYGTLEGANQPYYIMTNVNGDVTETVPGSPVQPYGLEMTGTTLNTFFPKMVGVRIYVSIGKPLQTSIPANGNPVNPSPITEQGNPNYNTIWDFAELSWTGQDTGTTTLGGNVTAVDAFGLALGLSRAGYDPAQPTVPQTVFTGFKSATARQDIITGMTAAGAPWDALLLSGKDGTVLRALQPNFGIINGTFPSNQMDSYIDALLEYYQSNDMKVVTTAGPTAGYVGRSDAAKRNFIFSPPAGVTGKTYTIPAPTTTELYQNQVQVKPNDGVGGALAAAFGASVLRTTLGTGGDPRVAVPQQARKLYYQNAPIFEYASILHEYAAGNHAFAFGYDEVAGDSGNPTVINPTGMTLTLLPY